VETIFLFFSNSDLELTNLAQLSISNANFKEATLRVRLITISYSLLWLVSRNHVSIFSHSDLDLDPSRPNINLDLYLKMLHLCTKPCWHLWGLFMSLIIKTIRTFRQTNKLTPLINTPKTLFGPKIKYCLLPLQRPALWNCRDPEDFIAIYNNIYIVCKEVQLLFMN